jgi:hypothetical protein
VGAGAGGGLHASRRVLRLRGRRAHPRGERVCQDRDDLSRRQPADTLFKGPLFIRFTNAETGKSIDRNASGNAFENLGPDGSLQTLTITDDGSHFVTRLPPGSQPSKGLFLVGGEWSSLVVNDDGTRSLFLGPDGSAENLCIPLSF